MKERRGFCKRKIRTVLIVVMTKKLYWYLSFLKCSFHLPSLRVNFVFKICVAISGHYAETIFNFKFFRLGLPQKYEYIFFRNDKIFDFGKALNVLIGVIVLGVVMTKKLSWH
jgi:hypothetical protein